MAQSFLLFDFGSNEEAAQQARHTVDRWKQGFRLDKKMLLKFDRKEPEQGEADGAGDAQTGKKAKNKTAAEPPAADHEHILLIVRLDFSDHEKLSYQRWLDRIPAEAPFKDAHPKVIRHGDAEFAATADRFEALD